MICKWCFWEVQSCRFFGYTTILNHPRGWGGKPKGLNETAGSPKYLNGIQATRLFLFEKIKARIFQFRFAGPERQKLPGEGRTVKCKTLLLDEITYERNRIT